MPPPSEPKLERLDNGSELVPESDPRLEREAKGSVVELPDRLPSEDSGSAVLVPVLLPRLPSEDRGSEALSKTVSTKASRQSMVERLCR